VPFVELRYHADRFRDAEIASLIDALVTEIAAAFSELAPPHRVTAQMIDVVVQAVGPLDRMHPDILITVLARREPARLAAAALIVARLTQVAEAAAWPRMPMVELVLTQHISTFNYREK
jgi:hypothetical protein